MTARQTILEEAYRLRLEAYVLYDLNNMVDYRTGELLETRHYESGPYHPQPDPLPPLIRHVRSLPGLEQFWEHIDCRTLVTLDHTRALYDQDKGRHHLKGTPIQFGERQYYAMHKLVRRLTYANSLITSPERLAKSLRIRRDNLYRWLGSLKPLVRVHGVSQGMAKGCIRIDIHPAYGFRHPRSTVIATQQQSIADWHRGLLQ